MTNKTILIGALGAIIFVGLFFARLYVSDVGHQYNNQKDNSYAILDSYSAAEAEQKAPSVKVPMASESNEKTSTSAACIKECEIHLEALRGFSSIDDDDFESLLGDIDAFIAYLKANPEARAEMMELALYSEDGNKRKIIITAFRQLTVSDQKELGLALAESLDSVVRREGINFLASSTTMDRALALEFADMLLTEQDEYVRLSLVKAFNQPDILRGDQEVLQTLEQIADSGLYDTVRGEVLLARVQLEATPENIFNDAVDAVRSKAADYQHYGIWALEQIMIRQADVELEISAANARQVETLFKDLMRPEFDDIPADVHKAADDLYERHF